LQQEKGHNVLIAYARFTPYKLREPSRCSPPACWKSARIVPVMRV